MAKVVQQKPPAKTGGDDLDDGLESDANLVASDSEPEEDGDLEPLEVGDDNDDAASVVYEPEDPEDLETDDSSREKKSVVGVKRKASDEEGDDTEEAKKADKKRRKKEKEKARKAKRAANAPNTAKTSPTLLTSSELSNLLLASIRESYPSATPMEINDLIIPSTSLLEPLEGDVPQAGDEAEGSLAPLQRRIRRILRDGPKLRVSMPRIVILSLSGLRCADVVRGVRDVRSDGQVAKLFAKHMKYAEQVKFLANTKCSIAVGTPARVGKLLSEEAIKVNQETVILLDIGHKDSKTRTLLTLPEIRDELWKSIFSGTARDHILKNGVKIGAF